VGEPLLRVVDLHAGYGQAEVLKGISLTVGEGETVGLIGPNGAGKSTLLKCIFGVVPVKSGRVFVGSGQNGSSPEQMIKGGVALVPEGRRVFGSLTVMENLVVGGYTRKPDAQLQIDLNQLLDRFPILSTRRNQMAGKLSGGEQQMLAIARALISRPRLLLMDEPSMGLAPIVTQELSKQINEIRDAYGTSVLLVEQDMTMVSAVASRVYVMNVGEIVATGSAADFLDQDRLAKAFWGGTAGDQRG
jgi:branched-chain amino acid transport system ATP-binding protein